MLPFAEVSEEPWKVRFEVAAYRGTEPLAKDFLRDHVPSILISSSFSFLLARHTYPPFRCFFRYRIIPCLAKRARASSNSLSFISTCAIILTRTYYLVITWLLPVHFPPLCLLLGVTAPSSLHCRNHRLPCCFGALYTLSNSARPALFRLTLPSGFFFKKYIFCFPFLFLLAFMRRIFMCGFPVSFILPDTIRLSFSLYIQNIFCTFAADLTSKVWNKADFSFVTRP